VGIIIHDVWSHFLLFGGGCSIREWHQANEEKKEEQIKSLMANAAAEERDPFSS